MRCRLQAQIAVLSDNDWQLHPLQTGRLRADVISAISHALTLDLAIKLPAPHETLLPACTLLAASCSHVQGSQPLAACDASHSCCQAYLRAVAARLASLVASCWQRCSSAYCSSWDSAGDPRRSGRSACSQRRAKGTREADRPAQHAGGSVEWVPCRPHAEQQNVEPLFQRSMSHVRGAVQLGLQAACTAAAVPGQCTALLKPSV